LLPAIPFSLVFFRSPVFPNQDLFPPYSDLLSFSMPGALSDNAFLPTNKYLAHFSEDNGTLPTLNTEEIYNCFRVKEEELTVDPSVIKPNFNWSPAPSSSRASPVEIETPVHRNIRKHAALYNPLENTRGTPPRRREPGNVEQPLQCGWILPSGATCGFELHNDHGSINSHLIDAHRPANWSLKEQPSLECLWNGCNNSIQWNSLVKHVSAKHMPPRVECPKCHQKFTRVETLRHRHPERNCLDNQRRTVASIEQGGEIWFPSLPTPRAPSTRYSLKSINPSPSPTKRSRFMPTPRDDDHITATPCPKRRITSAPSSMFRGLAIADVASQSTTKKRGRRN
jgi:hypothetical protein